MNCIKTVENYQLRLAYWGGVKCLNRFVRNRKVDVSVSRLAISECVAMEKSVRFAQRYWAYGRGEKCTVPCLQTRLSTSSPCSSMEKVLLLQKVAGGLLGCLPLSFGAVLAAGSLVEEAQRPAAPEHTKRLR